MSSIRRTRAEEHFERITSEGEAALDALIESEVSEELFLDYKRSGDNGKGPKKLHDDDRKNYAKAISGFGNSAGGVIIWGIECKENSERGDVPSKRVPLRNPKRFASWLEGATAGCTLPPHSGVRHFPIVLSDSEEGFVVTHIPESPLKPLRSIVKGKEGYFIRAGSSFLPTPHEVLMGMFGRSPVVDLNVVCRCYPVRKTDCDRYEVEVGFCFIHNTAALAKNLYMNIGVAPIDGAVEFQVAVKGEKVWDRSEFDRHSVQLVSKPAFRLAPGAMLQAASIICRFAPPFTNDSVFGITLGCEGSPISRHFVRVEKSIKEAAFQRWLGLEGEGDQRHRSMAFCADFFDLSKLSTSSLYEPEDNGRLGWGYGQPSVTVMSVGGLRI